MKVVRFRCPKCLALHSAPAARIGRVFPCKTCFGPLVVPGPPDGDAASRIPDAVLIPQPSADVPIARTPSGPSLAEPPVDVPAEKPPGRSSRPSRARRPAAPDPAPIPERSGPESEAPPFRERRSPPRDAVRRGLAASLVLVALVAAIIGLRGLAASRRDVALAVDPRGGPDAQALLPPAIEPQARPEPPASGPAVPLAPPEVVVLAGTQPPPASSIPPAKPAPRVDDPGRPAMVRRQRLDQEALRRQLVEVPEWGADEQTRAVLVALHGVHPPGTQGQPATRLDALAQAFVDRERAKPSRHAGRHQPAAPHAPARPTMHVARDEGAPHDLLAIIRQVQPGLTALPWRMGDECHLGREAAEDLQSVSRALRTLLVQVTPPGETRPDAERLRDVLLNKNPRAMARQAPAAGGVLEVTTSGNVIGPGNVINASRQPRTAVVVPAAIPALQQLLMAERTPVRLVLVDVLEEIPGRDATRALARLAMFDLAAEVRDRALLALKSRPAEDYRPALLEGLRYPWAPVADHAAEALVALRDREAVPALVDLLDRPDPVRPRAEVRDGRPVAVSSSLVQVNHLRNCVLCHAPSGDPAKDYVRGRVPDESQPLPPPIEYYDSASPGLFVKAEVTYLRQDFSATQPIEDSGPWPSYQRYDYLVIERIGPREDSDSQAKGQETYPQRDSILFALRELTGHDFGNQSADWKDGVVGTTPED